MAELPDERSVTHGGTRYVVVPVESCVDRAVSIRSAGKIWHTHVLSPGCRYNPFAGDYAVVIEDDHERTAYIASSTEFPEVDRELVVMLHGDDILDGQKTEAVTGVKSPSSTLLPRLRQLDMAGVEWHHHMNFPGCALSPDPSGWVISVESAGGDFSEVFPGEPVDVLREVEVLYFANLDHQEAGER
jgi:hypothetical protein